MTQKLLVHAADTLNKDRQPNSYSCCLHFADVTGNGEYEVLVTGKHEIRVTFLTDENFGGLIS